MLLFWFLFVKMLKIVIFFQTGSPSTKNKHKLGKKDEENIDVIKGLKETNKGLVKRSTLHQN